LATNTTYHNPSFSSVSPPLFDSLCAIAVLYCTWPGSSLYAISLSIVILEFSPPTPSCHVHQLLLWGIAPHSIEAIRSVVGWWKKSDPRSTKHLRAATKSDTNKAEWWIGSDCFTVAVSLMARRNQRIDFQWWVHARRKGVIQGGGVDEACCRNKNMCCGTTCLLRQYIKILPKLRHRYYFSSWVPNNGLPF